MAQRLPWVILLGLFLRLAMFFSSPVLEDDYYRYLWDGAVTAHGFDPYRFSPRQVREGRASGIPPGLRALADEAGPILEGINYPWLRTLYPPLAQAGFALAHQVSPWRLWPWRLILLLADLATLFLLLRIVRAWHLPLNGIALYWLNPLLIKEIYNSAHMDILLLPFLLGALVWFWEGRRIYGALCLGLAAGVKLWPVVLLPLFLRSLPGTPRRWLAPGLLCLLLLAAAIAPMARAGLDREAGLTAYAGSWEMNDGLFMLVAWGAGALLKTAWLSAGTAQAVARVAVAASVLFAALWFSREKASSLPALARRALMVTAVLFFLSPTQFPWYYVWMMPWLALAPCLPLWLLTALLPLYYTRFCFVSQGMTGIYDHGIVWLQFLPVFAAVAFEIFRQRKKGLGIDQNRL